MKIKLPKVIDALLDKWAEKELELRHTKEIKN